MRTNLFKFLLRRKFIAHREDVEAEKEFSECCKKLKLEQLKFQKNDSVPVFLKGGAFDKILFLTTMGLSGLGLIGTFEFIYKKAFTKKIQVQKAKD
jgi:hypothetical protein